MMERRITETQTESNNQIIADGTKQTRQEMILAIIKETPGLMADEIKSLLPGHLPDVITKNGVQARISELQDQGLVEVYGKKWNKTTERNNDTYIAPQIPNKPRTKKKAEPNIWNCKSCKTWGYLPDNWKCGKFGCDIVLSIEAKENGAS